MTQDVRRAHRLTGAPLRVFCGILTVGLSLVCVYSSFGAALTSTGNDSPTYWIFFVWGLAVACGGVRLLIGRSKGMPIVLVRERKRLVPAAVLFVVIIGMLAYFAGLPLTEDDPSWPLMLQTMFAVLFASLPFMLFDRADYRERNKSVPLNNARRRKMRRTIILLAVLGGVMAIGGILAGMQGDAWWVEGLLRLGFLLLSASAVLGFQLKKAARS